MKVGRGAEEVGWGGAWLATAWRRDIIYYDREGKGGRENYSNTLLSHVMPGMR